MAERTILSCDRCGREAEGIRTQHLLVIHGDEVQCRFGDLCPKCSSAVSGYIDKIALRKDDNEEAE